MSSRDPAVHDGLRLNVGCGTDYRPGHVNIDASDALPRIDLRIDLKQSHLTDHFTPGSVHYVLANDVLEHVHRWEAIAMLEQFHAVLRPGGTCEIRVPDAAWILRTWRYGVDRKITLLFGGQDRPQGRDPAMDEARSRNPEWFCHRYAWTRRSLTAELRAVGFSSVRTRRAGTNFVAAAVK